MQIGGIGGGMGAHDSTHQVTNCIHDHDAHKKEAGGMKLQASDAHSAARVAQNEEKTYSLADILRNVVSAGRNFLGYIWSGDAAGSGPVENAAEHAGVAAASANIRHPQELLKDNPYFTTNSDPGMVKENVFKKIRIKFRDITGYLTRHRFAGPGHGTLNNKKQEQQKGDLRKHSRYREKGQEIDCILTDDSYLLDSYDRRGEYSRLTTKMGFREENSPK